ncbi:hypothetical protein V493_06474 [Pseudogymnoascus sp. VKM F-4281 (FW-2241)]|nr:hypothetical protein V493_06474 [Pseudogymnoascus sp. VKM F-4281 (FW-2241)]
MSFYPHAFFSSPSPSTSTTFSPLFRLLDEYDTHARQTPRQVARAEKTFVPKFDVKELPNHFELHGELAGINQSDVTIEFTDSQTMSIRGRAERSYTAGNPAATIEAGTPSLSDSEEGTTTPKSNHQATVEDEDAPANAVAVQESAQPEKPRKKEPEERLWISERSIGSFARSFAFPGRIDQDGVTASMKNGILSVVVPKAKKHESRKIEIS